MISLTFTEPIKSDILVGFYMEYTINQDLRSPEFFDVTSEVKCAGKPVYHGERDVISITKSALARMLREIERGEKRASSG